MNILFLGGDKRYEYMMRNLSKKHSIYQVGFDNIASVHTEYPTNLNLEKFDIVIFPINGLNDNLEVKTPKGLLYIPSNVFENISKTTIFFTGLKTKKILEFIPLEQIVSFLDFEEVEMVNNSLTVQGVMEDIKDENSNTVCILGYRKTWKGTILKTKKSWF